MDEPTSIAGQIISLRDRGFSVGQIRLEMQSRGVRMSDKRVKATLKRVEDRSADSRRLFELWESQLEILAGMREILNILRTNPERLAARMRTIEQRGLPAKLGAALDRATESSSQ